MHSVIMLYVCPSKPIKLNDSTFICNLHFFKLGDALLNIIKRPFSVSNCTKAPGVIATEFSTTDNVRVILILKLPQYVRYYCQQLDFFRFLVSRSHAVPDHWPRNHGVKRVSRPHFSNLGSSNVFWLHFSTNYEKLEFIFPHLDHGIV